MLDRITGGVSMLIHSPATVQPNQRIELPFLKLHVYVPPHVLAENEHVDRELAKIIQLFAKSLALPATHCWNAALVRAGVTLTGDKNSQRNAIAPSSLPFMPAPMSRTSRFVCYGRAEGELERMLETVDVGSRDRDGPGRHDGTSAGQVDTGSTRSDTQALESEATALRAQVAELESLVAAKDAQILQLQEELDDARRGQWTGCCPAVESASRVRDPEE